MNVWLAIIEEDREIDVTVFSTQALALHHAAKMAWNTFTFYRDKEVESDVRMDLEELFRQDRYKEFLTKFGSFAWLRGLTISIEVAEKKVLD